MGLDNYTEVLTDPAFWRSAGLSLVWVAANAVVQTALALATALILHQQVPGGADSAHVDHAELDRPHGGGGHDLALAVIDLGWHGESCA